MNANKIALKKGSTYLFKNTIDILYFNVLGNKTTVHLQGGEQFNTINSIKHLESNLPDDFYRIHRSYMVNLNHVNKILDKDGLKVVLENGTMLECSRARRRTLLNQLKTI